MYNISCQINAGRLSNDSYDKPKKTITDTLQTTSAIKEKLYNYEEVSTDKIQDIPIGSHIRYISYDVYNKQELFRTGGIIKMIRSEYLVLSGKNNKTFSVQRYIRDPKSKSTILYTTKIFKKLKESAKLKKDLELVVDKSDKMLQKQNEVILKQNKELLKLKKLLKSKNKKKT